MSVRLMSLVWDITLADSEKIVLLALADNANDSGECWPSIATLARKCSKGERTVQKTIQRLVELGHLTRIELAGRGCRYFVHPRNDCAPATTAPPQRTTDTPAAAAPKPSRTIIRDIDIGAGENRNEISETEPPDQWADLPDWIPRDAWIAFAAMRQDKQKPISPGGVRGMVHNLERLRDQGHDPAAVLEQSTAHCWTGVFPITDPNTPYTDRRNRYGNARNRIERDEISNPFARAALELQAERAARQRG